MDESEFTVENNIKSDAELFEIGDEQKKTWKKDLENFVPSHLTKVLSDLLENTLKMGRASKNVFCSKQTRWM